jgi:hypothetical protein
MKKKIEEFPKLLINFFGQIVRITTKQSSTATIVTEQGPIVETYPLSYEGILIDEDETHYYLGKNIKNISIRVKKSEEVGMEVIEEEDELDEILKHMPEPNSNEVN